MQYRFKVFLGCLYILVSCADVSAQEALCTYTTYKWNTLERRAVDYKRIEHPYSELKPIEIHTDTGCTVCREDQVDIRIPGVPAFKVCRVMADDIKAALYQAMTDGQYINSIVGYRVGMTKGEADAIGNRTQFSNHSFGIAIDINTEQNGLYSNCITFGPQCRLHKGGHWDPSQPGSITEQSPIVRYLSEMGMQWGGKILGRQKDFMHFSPSGY